MTTSEVFKIERECILRNESDNCNRDCASCDLVIDCDEILKAYDKVLDLLKKQEQGLIIELPIPIGSIVWGMNTDNSKVMQMLFRSSQIESVIKWWGKTVFATREEAEARLKELKNE